MRHKRKFKDWDWEVEQVWRRDMQRVGVALAEHAEKCQVDIKRDSFQRNKGPFQIVTSVTAPNTSIYCWIPERNNNGDVKRWFSFTLCKAVREKGSDKLTNRYMPLSQVDLLSLRWMIDEALKECDILSHRAIEKRRKVINVDEWLDGPTHDPLLDTIETQEEDK